MINVVLVDFGCKIPHQDLVDCAQALTIQATQHFGQNPPHGYGYGALVRAAAGQFDVRPSEWVLGLFTHPDQPGALGYHDQTPHGQPFAKVFPLIDPGTPWTSIASHELIEMLLDPNVSRCAILADGRVAAYEGCDGVEATGYSIRVSSGANVAVSNFALPPYFEQVADMRGLKYDWMGLCKQQFEILPGGYNQVYDPQQGWTQLDHAMVPKSAYRMAVADHGRGAARRNA